MSADSSCAGLEQIALHTPPQPLLCLLGAKQAGGAPTKKGLTEGGR